MCLPAFYYFLGSASAQKAAQSTEDYPFTVAQTYSQFSDLSTLTLACRKLFDHAGKLPLTGANFGRTSDQVLVKHAEHWAARCSTDVDATLLALTFLRRFFAEYSKTDSLLLKSDGYLHKRIGLLKQHADRAAAHLSLEDYALDIEDLAHFTASVVIAAEVIRSFDIPWLSSNYFNDLDNAAYEAATRAFPQIVKFRLFGNMHIHRQARFYWMNQELESIKDYFDRLQFAHG